MREFFTIVALIFSPLSMAQRGAGSGVSGHIVSCQPTDRHPGGYYSWDYIQTQVWSAETPEHEYFENYDDMGGDLILKEFLFQSGFNPLDLINELNQTDKPDSETQEYLMQLQRSSQYFLSALTAGQVEGVPQQSCFDIMKKVRNHFFVSGHPTLATGLNSYIKSLEAPLGSSAGRRQWLPLRGLSTPLSDKAVLKKTPLPSNCNLSQFAIKADKKSTPTELVAKYYINRKVREALLNDPKHNLQCAYSFLHEWARDLINQPENIYLFVNRIILESYLEHFGELGREVQDRMTTPDFDQVIACYEYLLRPDPMPSIELVDFNQINRALRDQLLKSYDNSVLGYE